MPKSPVWAENAVMWHSDIADVVRNDIGEAVWGDAENKAKVEHGFLDGVKRKNSLLIAATLEELSKRGSRSEILEKLCVAILEFASKH